MKLSQIRLLQLVSPSLPVGAFAYSQGLESAVEAGLVIDDNSTYKWIDGVLSHSLQYLDLPVLNCCLDAFKQQNNQEVHRLNEKIWAFRETVEIRNESSQMAIALRRLMKDMGHDVSALQNKNLDWVTAFAYACYINQIEAEDALTAYAWSWCENQIAAAIKLVPLGQTQGQVLLNDLGERIVWVVRQAQAVDQQEIGATAPQLAILSCQHETQYSRLFRS